jgi:hypothetical protein
MGLLRSLATALDGFWANDGDERRHQRFAQAAITPLYTRGEPVLSATYSATWPMVTCPVRCSLTKQSGVLSSPGRTSPHWA